MKLDNDGYRRSYTPDGEYVVHYPNSPSNKRRRLRDVVVEVRKHGLAWPVPSKKEQRAQRRKGGS